MSEVAISKIGWNIPVFDAAEGERRHRAVREAMLEEGYDCLLIAGHQGNYGDRAANVRYVANYEPWYDDEYVLFPVDGEPVLYAWSEPHADWCRKVSWIENVIPAAQMSRGYSGKGGYPTAVGEHLRGLRLERARVGVVDFETLPTSIYLGLRRELPEAELVDAGSLLARIRMVKSPAELEFMERAARIGDIGIEAMAGAARPGVTETEVWAACEHAMTLAGASPPSFSMLASCSRLPEKGLGLPYAGSGRTLQRGDVILNELSPSYGGYWNQLDAPIVLGPVTDELADLLAIHEAMYDAALATMRPGISIGEVNETTRVVAEEMGADASPAWTVANIGLRIRDDLPRETPLEAGMTLVVQPLTQHGGGAWGGHTIGTTAVVTETGCRVLNADPRVHVVAPS